MSMENHQPNPKQNDDSRHPFLPLSHQDEKSRAFMSELLRAAEILLQDSDEAEQHFIPVFTHEVSQHWNSELLEPWIIYKGFWVLAKKSRRKEKVTSTLLSDELHRKGSATR